MDITDNPVTSTTIEQTTDTFMGMFEIMGIVLGSVFFLIAVIVAVFFVKSCRRRRENIRIYKYNQRSQQGHILSIQHQGFGVDVRPLNTQLNVPGDQSDDITESNESSSEQNGTYINNSVQVNSDSMYDLTTVPIPVNIEYKKEENTRTMSTFISKPGHRGVNTLNIIENKIKNNDNTPKHSQTLDMYDKRRGNVRNIDRDDLSDYPDYENSPEKRRKEAKQLTTIPPPNNNKMIRVHNDAIHSKPQILVKQDSDYEDPDKVVALRKLGIDHGFNYLINFNKDNSTKSEVPEYSNLQINGLVVKSERFPNSLKRDYVNETVINDLKMAPPVPIKKRAHTTATYDWQHRPVVTKRGRTFSNSDLMDIQQDDVYVPMGGKQCHDEDDMYVPMDSNDNVDKIFYKQPNTTATPREEEILPPVRFQRPGPREEIIPPVLFQKPATNMVPKRSYEKNYTLNVKPPPCGVGSESKTEYVNYDENSKYVNLFKSRSNDDIYVYADAEGDTW